ncbi:F-box/FBD/LRR-repeat protein [Raphanus sativus]|uniref:FBD-associated F-box protein At5g56700 n=1 Tax=Raphanus sativus TaxID=3726 RepID=A0A6J0M1G3_RAPSA|nr:putative FBD-associated F-box protein At5g56700 [Raphanus sativus]KAJ4897005.1 F-box/FBD/LRR-repeat protein [Raphanus sativus]
MGMISDLPDQMLLEILSWLPTREVVATMLLSRQWEFLWKQVPTLDHAFSQNDGKDSSDFVNTFLRLNESPVFRSFKLSVSPYCDARNVRTWIDFAVSRRVRHLEIDLTAARKPMITTLPKRLYTCGTLTCLNLKALVLDEIPEEYPIRLASLHYLYLSVSSQVSGHMFMCKLNAGAPLLKRSVVRGDDVYNKQFLDYIARKNSLKSFTLCSSEWDPVTIGPYFKKLEHFCMCTCSPWWWDLLIAFLKYSPKLRSLQLTKSCNLRRCFLWAEPITTSGPQCLSSTLQTLEWRDYTDTQFDKDVISFLLKNATCLTKVKIVPVTTTGHIEKLRIQAYLSNLSRGSTACQLIFP